MADKTELKEHILWEITERAVKLLENGLTIAVEIPARLIPEEGKIVLYGCGNFYNFGEFISTGPEIHVIDPEYHGGLVSGRVCSLKKITENQ